MSAVDDIDETLQTLRTRSSSAKSSSTKTRIGFATSTDLKGFSRDSPGNSAESDNNKWRRVAYVRDRFLSSQMRQTKALAKR
jgi:hypothetical protein